MMQTKRVAQSGNPFFLSFVLNDQLDQVDQVPLLKLVKLVKLVMQKFALFICSSFD